MLLLLLLLMMLQVLLLLLLMMISDGLLRVLCVGKGVVVLAQRSPQLQSKKREEWERGEKENTSIKI